MGALDAGRVAVDGGDLRGDRAQLAGEHAFATADIQYSVAVAGQRRQDHWVVVDVVVPSAAHAGMA